MIYTLGKLALGWPKASVRVSGVNRAMTRAELFGQVAGCNRIATASSLTVRIYIFEIIRIIYRFIAGARRYVREKLSRFVFVSMAQLANRESVNSVALCACRAMALRTRYSASVRI